MSRIHKEHLQAGYIFGDTINQEYIYLPSGEVGTDHPLAVLETPTKREDLTLDEAVHMIDTLTLKRCSHPKPKLVDASLYFTGSIHFVVRRIADS